jgi:hypothetical protein
LAIFEKEQRTIMAEKSKRYRLTLDFSVSIDDEILQPYPGEDQLEEEEKIRLSAERALFKGLLADQEGIREELIRKLVLEDADGAVHIYDLAKKLLVRDLDDKEFLWPIIDPFEADEWNYFQQAWEQENFEEATSEVLSCFDVELEAASLVEVDSEGEE